ncbi:MAG: hypothetical protein E7576_06895 [Ruminococcaceae bacterium]|nr:hypothetical protein [Oscillospiraceae bacterium]
MSIDKAKDWCREKADKVKKEADYQIWRLEEWAKNNPEQAATIAATAIGAVGFITRKAIKAGQLRKEMRLKDRYIYDRSLGSYWMLRRKPTQTEMLKIERMRKAGMSYGDILTSLRLL